MQDIHRTITPAQPIKELKKSMQKLTHKIQF